MHFKTIQFTFKKFPPPPQLLHPNMAYLHRDTGSFYSIKRTFSHCKCSLSRFPVHIAGITPGTKLFARNLRRNSTLQQISQLIQSFALQQNFAADLYQDLKNSLSFIPLCSSIDVKMACLRQAPSFRQFALL